MKYLKLRKLNKEHCNIENNDLQLCVVFTIDTVSDLKLLLYILQFENGQFYASTKDIARKVGLKESTIKSSFKRLENMGIIKRNTASNQDKGFGGKTRYVDVDEDRLIALYNEKKTFQNNMNDKKGTVPVEPLKEKKNQSGKLEIGAVDIEDHCFTNTSRNLNDDCDATIIGDNQKYLKFDNPNIKELLGNYVDIGVRNNQDLITVIDQVWTKHRVDNNIQLFNIIDFHTYLTRFKDDQLMNPIIEKFSNDLSGMQNLKI
ncbi:helix-turn-helix domain-containing protein [Gramella lutea]|uniref:Helix-turn-helix domain-containing protein n=1 Tax=Christiangramia lutea TaxID=1607951 RepID=A0A9X2ABC3_9FLAO|nr:helix-turn-helix domain-containing protein [Christiangramia lutea]MCH4822988.1 helix-turn-helix domain-containing protein [Christiangramia lutea]